MAKRQKRENASTGVTSPRVARVTPEGRLVYDPGSVVRSGPARKHLKELEANNPTKVPVPAGR